MKSIPIDKAIEIALEQHRAGQFVRAESLYMEILRQDPGNVDAMHLLGVLAHQGHKPEIAEQFIGAAITKRPNIPVFHYNLAEAQAACGKREEAIASYRRAIELAPDYFEAHNNLANALNAGGHHSEAESECRKAMEINPAAPPPYNNLGNALRGLNRLEEAATMYRRAIELRPEFAEAVNNLAMCLCGLGQFDEGIEQFRQAIRLDPAQPDLHNNLGTVLSRMGRYKEAGACFQTAIDIAPEHAEANNNLGGTLRNLGQLPMAIPLFEKAIKIKPDFIGARNNLASALKDTGKRDEALTEIDAAIALNPALPREHFMRAMILRDLHRLDDAIEALRETLRLSADDVPALTALGYALLERGDLDEAMSVLGRSIDLKPDPQTHSNVLLAVNYHPGYSPADLLKIHQSWAELHEKPHVPKWLPHLNDRNPERKLRVGYVSPDFRGHVVGFFLEPILANHDHEKVEVYGYAQLTATDIHTWRLRAQIDHWREIATMTHDQVADKIREDQIDILVELAGHTGGNSLPVFARKPAPVQINMIGFPSTTGLTAIDYRITDERCDPPGASDPFNSETLLRLPELFWSYQPPENAPEVGRLPAEENGYVTFTSVNNFTKVTPQVQKLWAQLLVAVPNSRLILQTSALSSRHTQEFVKSIFGEAGVSLDRLDFRTWTDMPNYLKLLERSDITLDPFPFNGGTTTCHSLWMGAPVLTLAGDRHASRMGLSMLTAIGLPEFIAHSPQQYVDIAATFAKDLPRLAAIRAGMRERLQKSPLLDGAGYTRHLEAAYREVWRKWCATGV